MRREGHVHGILIALLAVTLLGTALWTSSCSQGGGTDTVDDDDPEDNPPSRVTDLTVIQATSASVTLRWTAPHGGSPAMVAYAYDLRYGASPIDESIWTGALEIDDEPAPLPCGGIQTVVITGTPADTTLYFALRTRSVSGLWSEISNSAAAVVPPETGIVFADSSLEAVVRAIVQKPEGDLVPADVAEVSEVQANDLGIRSLAGLEYCVSLARLNIRGNSVTDLSPLAGLTRLADLDASDNDIADLQPLAGLEGLINLSLGGNEIENLGPLEGLQVLNVLYLNGNRIENLAPVAGCFRLNHLFLGSNRISELGPLTGLIYLANLDLAGNLIEDLAALIANAGLGSGDQIWIAGNPLSPAALNEQIPALRERGAMVYD